jgi:zinc protease
MRKILIFGSLILTGILSACAHSGNSTPAPAKPTVATHYQLRPFEVQTLENGLKIIWVKDAKLPVVSLALALRSGGAFDPKGQEGLAEMTAQLLDKGIPGRNAMKIADDLELRADAFSISVDSDATFATMHGLSFHAVESLNDFAQLVMHPTFPKVEVARQRKITVARLSRLADRPADFANFVFEHEIFGDHPYAHGGVGLPPTVAKITRNEVVKFHQQFYSPDRATLAVVGQFDDDYKNSVIKAFSAWKKGPVITTVIKDPVESKGVRILEIVKPDMQQMEVRLGHVGIKRNVPDYLAIKVANSILGESAFTARLFREIRIKRALTYSVRSAFDVRQLPGVFEISTFTRNDKIHEMIDSILKVLNEFHDKGVTDSEVDLAKAALKSRFPRLLETGTDLAHQLLLLDVYGVSYDYLRDFQEEVEKVTTADVNAAILRHFHPDNLQMLIFGPTGNKGLETLKDFGTVTVEDYKKAL